METSQYLLQAIPLGGSPLLQVPSVDNNVLRDLRLFSQGKSGVTNIQDLLGLDPQQQRKALSRLNEKQFQQAINIAKNIPILVVSNVHFKGTTTWFYF
jgi:translocation protein SEC63